jgi:predicted Rossmann fold flavoprotein
MRFDVIVIGAGAAGMMCAAQAGRRGRRTLLVEHAAKVGERIRISGGGRCNFSNRRVGAENFLSRNAHFCRSALARFTPQDFLALVERHGIAYEEREHGQLFCLGPAQGIVEMLRRECDDAGVEWAHPCAVGRIEKVAPGFALASTGGPLECASLVVATGGLAVPKLGATPFGYRLAEQFGLGIVAPKPALVPLALAPADIASLGPLAGVAFDTRARARPGPAFRESALITHRGLSGPAILQASSYWQMEAGRQPLELDLLPGVDAGEWLAARARSKARLSSLLAEHLPGRFAREWCARYGLDKPLDAMTGAERTAAAAAIGRWHIMPSGTLGYAKAEVTLGGVDTDELSSKTLEAKRVAGLYFVGEVVDVTGWLGGYNFQWAWASGWVAGQAA